MLFVFYPVSSYSIHNSHGTRIAERTAKYQLTEHIIKTEESLLRSELKAKKQRDSKNSKKSQQQLQEEQLCIHPKKQSGAQELFEIQMKQGSKICNEIAVSCAYKTLFPLASCEYPSIWQKCQKLVSHLENYARFVLSDIPYPIYSFLLQKSTPIHIHTYIFTANGQFFLSLDLCWRWNFLKTCTLPHSRSVQ